MSVLNLFKKQILLDLLNGHMQRFPPFQHVDLSKTAHYSAYFTRPVFKLYKHRTSLITDLTACI